MNIRRFFAWPAILVISTAAVSAPQGEITAPPEGSCHGPGDLPVAVEDSFGAAPDLGRRYLPRGGIRDWRPPADDDVVGSVGGSLVLDGERLVVGAAGEAGAVYLLRRAGEDWHIEQILRPPAPPGEPPGIFGAALALHGDALAVGGPDTYGGAVYVYRHDGQVWRLEAVVAPSDPGSRSIGKAVALEGDVLVVTATEWRPVDGAIGVAYVYRHDGAGGWQREAVLTADPIDHDDRFGEAVALHAGEIYVGCRQYGPGLYEWGAVFRFAHDGNGWRQTDMMLAPDPIRDHNFGSSVALDGETLVIGAYHDDDLGIYSGSAYTYQSYGTHVWSFEKKLLPPDGATWWQFGSDVAVDGDWLAVGAWLADSSDGAVYLWKRTELGWIYDRRVLPQGDTVYLGRALSIDPPVTAMGAGDRIFIDGASPPSHYWLHGSYTVRLEARDPGGLATDSVRFAIDLRPPQVWIWGAGRIVLPADVPAGDMFSANDRDGATGGVVHERALWDDCLLFDGNEYGNRDGLLSDEVLHFDEELFCEAILRCDLSGVDEPWVRVEATDCGGNVGVSDWKRKTVYPAITREDCE